MSGFQTRGGAIMKHYAGLDVSLNETSVCIVDETGAYVGEAKVASDPAALANYLQSSGLSFGRVGLEACPLSQWLYSGLAAAGFPVVCVEVRRVKAALSEDRSERRARHRANDADRLVPAGPCEDQRESRAALPACCP
jgi:transposase